MSETRTETDEVLSANLEFYRALTSCDYPAMNAVWARDVPVHCVHPGWPAIVGREAVMQSWHGILANPEPTRVACHDDRAVVYPAFAVVICEEELSAGLLVATNMFVKEGGRWRMFHHQASPLIGRQRPAPLQPRRRRR
jgi:ketosteroid isomerase-like protein